MIAHFQGDGKDLCRILQGDLIQTCFDGIGSVTAPAFSLSQPQAAASSPVGGGFWSLPQLDLSLAACFVPQQGKHPKASSFGGGGCERSEQTVGVLPAGAIMYILLRLCGRVSFSSFLAGRAVSANPYGFAKGAWGFAPAGARPPAGRGPAPSPREGPQALSTPFLGFRRYLAFSIVFKNCPV